jgi:HSP20 family protein
MTRPGDRNPFAELRSVQKRLNQLFEGALARSNFEAPDGFDSWTPVCDAYETAQALVLCLELPGLGPDDIDLKLEGDELAVRGERRTEPGQSGERYHRVERSFGKFERSFPLPPAVDRGAVRASYRDGVLRVELPTTGRKQPAGVRVEIE